MPCDQTWRLFSPRNNRNTPYTSHAVVTGDAQKATPAQQPAQRGLHITEAPAHGGVPRALSWQPGRAAPPCRGAAHPPLCSPATDETLVRLPGGASGSTQLCKAHRHLQSIFDGKTPARGIINHLSAKGLAMRRRYRCDTCPSPGQRGVPREHAWKVSTSVAEKIGKYSAASARTAPATRQTASRCADVAGGGGGA